MLEILLILVLLQIKHWYIDFVNQSTEEINHKGIYWHWSGMKHSVKHGIGTAVILLPAVPVEWALVLGILDLVIHYNIDWFKMNKGNKDVTSSQFWNHLGLDQMAHQLTYLFIVAIIVL